jgi:hypothetical protein
MLIPQRLDDKGIAGRPAQVVLKYTITNVYSGTTDEIERVLPLELPSLREWQPGMGIDYQITIHLIGEAHIEFDIEGFVDGTEWKEKNGGSGNSVPGTVG